MARFLLISFFLLSVALSEFIFDGLNRLTEGTLKPMLDAKMSVLAFWYTSDCVKCGQQLWDIQYTVYAFGSSKKYLVAANTFNADDSLVKKYGIKENHEEVTALLFVEGSEDYVTMDEDDTLLEWVSQHTGLVPNPDYSMVVSASNYNQFVRKMKEKNVLMMFYIPSQQNSQSSIYPYFSTAKAFHSIKSLLFARVDCSLSQSVCEYLQVQMLPEIRLFNNSRTPFDGKILDFRRREGIDSYLNRYLGTFLRSAGGLNEKYGRDDMLDVLAHTFMDESSLANYKRVMKQVLKAKQSHPAAFRYYKIMKNVAKNGPNFVIEERERIQRAVEAVDEDSKEYAKLRAMQNVLTQFEHVEIAPHAVVSLTQDSFDFVVNGKRNVMVKFFAPWCGHCRALAPIYEELAKVAFDGVVIAEIDADHYKDIGDKYGVQGYPTLLWFAKGEDPLMPKMVDSARTVDSLMGYMEEQLKNSGDWVEPAKEKKEEEEEHAGEEASQEEGKQEEEEQQKKEEQQKETGVEEENVNEEL